MMSRIILSVVSSILWLTAMAQNPVSWTFTARPLGNDVYAITLSAKVAAPWHIYSQTSPDGGPQATLVKFNNNPLIKLDGTVAENGKIITHHEEVFDVDVKYFEGDASFVQLIKVKPGIKTNITGSVEFMSCTNEQCIPAKDLNFSIALNK